MLSPGFGVSHPIRRRFGRRPAALAARTVAAPSLAEDLRLFAMFFLGGLTFMSVYLA